jgi:3-methyladenine DNA glycosylase/8-oxoguanine DNA glycosylase
VPSVLAVPARLDLARTVGIHRIGRHDPTTVTGPDEARLARRTPDGPGTIRLRRNETGLVVEQWGPGGPWLAARAGEIAGLHDEPPALTAHHPAVARALHRVRGLHLSRLELVHPPLVATILAQRVTSLEAVRQWSALVRAFGEPAPGPGGLHLPPDPVRIAETPYWWFHRLGIERRRAEVLQRVSARVERLERAATLDGPGAEALLRSVPGIGVWTAAGVRTALGDPDAVAVGDYHLCHTVVHALTGRARGSDAEMLDLLEPYRPNRGRIVRLLLADGWAAPRFGPRRAIPPVARW